MQDFIERLMERFAKESQWAGDATDCHCRENCQIHMTLEQEQSKTRHILQEMG